MTGRYPTRTGFEFTPIPEGMGRVVSTISNAMPNTQELPTGTFNREADKNRVPYQDQGLPGEEITIAELLKQIDYHTVHIGKWHLGRNSEMSPNAQGFDESLLMHSGLFLEEDDPNVVNAKLEFDPIDRFLWAAMQYAASFNMGEPYKPGGYLTDWWTDE
ncbi:MAG: sulfatase-like hydrolase/transferase, partial [Pseudomonadota bacterium]